MSQNTARRLFRSRPRGVQAHATVFKVERADNSTSRQLSFQDEFAMLSGINGAQIVLPTPYNVQVLFSLIEQSNMLRQCIDAFVTNTVLTGWEVDPSIRDRKTDNGERNELQSFIEHANSEESLATVMEKTIRDRESVGFGFLEIIRDAVGDISLLRNAPALYTRLCPKHPQEVLVEYDVARGRRIATVREYRLFRRYMQIVAGRQVWFKEFGDPRKMDYRNGAFEGESGYDPRYQATEIFHFKNPSNEPYGVPRWINQLPSIIGSREAEEVNMRYFKDNTVPPMMLTVSNGRLTQQSYRELTRAINEDGIGSERQNKILLIEAIGEGDSMDGKTGNVDLKIEKLTDARQSDGLFNTYDAANMNKVRSSFRLPPVIVGMSQDVNFATANVSAFIAESQVFAPERSKIDEILNKIIVNGRTGLGLLTVKLTSRIPTITSPDMVIKSMTMLNVMGAMTPRSAQSMANKMLQIEMTPYPEKGQDGYEDWMDRPIVFARTTPGGLLNDPTGADDTNHDGAADETSSGVDLSNPDGSNAVDANGNPTAGGNTHAAQRLKTPAVKKLEKTGAVGQGAVKNGEQ